MAIYLSRSSRAGRRYNVFVNIIVILFGALWIFISIKTAQATNKKLEIINRCTSSVSITADKVDKEQRWTSDDNGGHYETWYIIHYSFEASGKKITDRYDTTKAISENKKFIVVYNSDDPNEHFTIWEKNSVPESKTMAYVFIGIGVLIILWGLSSFIRSIVIR